MKTLEFEKFDVMSMKEKKIYNIDDWPKVKGGIR